MTYDHHDDDDTSFPIHNNQHIGSLYKDQDYDVFNNSDVRLAMYVMFDLLCVMFDLLYVRIGMLLICGSHLDDRYQVKSAPGHFRYY